jgi:hypothetical protein
MKCATAREVRHLTWLSPRSETSYLAGAVWTRATARPITSPVKQEGVRRGLDREEDSREWRSTRSTKSVRVAEDFCDVRVATWRRNLGQGGPGEPGAEWVCLLLAE